MRRDKLQKLVGGNLSRYAEDFLAPGATKIGDGLENIVLSPDKMESNSPTPANAGFSFSSQGSKVRQGSKLDVEGDYQKVFFKNGEQQLNPMGHIKASSTTDPLPTILTSFRADFLSFFTDDLQSLLAPLRAVV